MLYTSASSVPQNKANFHCCADQAIGVPRGPSVRNKANPRGLSAGSAGRAVQTKPISARPGRSQWCRSNPSCETKPILENRPAGAGGQLCKTNPISESRPAGEIPIIPLFYRSSIPIRCLSCGTKPMAPERATRESISVRDRSCDPGWEDSAGLAWIVAFGVPRLRGSD